MKRFASLAVMAAVLFAATPVPAQQAALPARLETLATQGNAEAAYHLGMIYHLGLEGVAIDRRRALEYFRRSAGAGDPLGAYKLGCYYAGQGGDALATNDALALRYKLVAAQAGYDLAQMDVGRIYSDRGDWAQALRWYDAAARQGNWTALFMALLRVMPDSPHPNRARAWLYIGVIERALPEISSGASEDELRQLGSARAEMRRAVETGLSAADRAQGERLLAAWREERSPITLRAERGLNAARRLVGLPEAAADASR